jgi:hypothetical protein
MLFLKMSVSLRFSATVLDVFVFDLLDKSAGSYCTVVPFKVKVQAVRFSSDDNAEDTKSSFSSLRVENHFISN